VVLRVCRSFHDGQLFAREEAQRLVEFVVLAVAYDCVAEVEAHEHAARRVEFEHAAHVRREVRLALRGEDVEEARGRAGEGGEQFPRDLDRVVEADEAGPCPREDAELLPALAPLNAELRLLEDRKSTRLNSSHSQISY